MDDIIIFFSLRDQDTSLLILVQIIDFKRVEEMVSNEAEHLGILMEQKEIDKLDYTKRMKLAEVKISLDATFKDTTEVSRFK